MCLAITVTEISCTRKWFFSFERCLYTRIEQERANLDTIEWWAERDENCNFSQNWSNLQTMYAFSLDIPKKRHHLHLIRLSRNEGAVVWSSIFHIIPKYISKFDHIFTNSVFLEVRSMDRWINEKWRRAEGCLEQTSDEKYAIENISAKSDYTISV